VFEDQAGTGGSWWSRQPSYFTEADAADEPRLSAVDRFVVNTSEA